MSASSILPRMTAVSFSRRHVRSLLPVAAAVLSIGFWIAMLPAAQANTRVNQDQPPPALVQTSPSITIDYTTDHLVAAYADDPFAGNGIGVSYRTHSVAGPWIDGAFTAPAGGYFGIEEDASVASDNTGFVYASYVSYDNLAPNNQNSAVYVARSNDGGATFPTTAQVVLRSGPIQATPFVIQPKLEADDFGPGSPHAGNVYVVWEEDLPGVPFWRFSDINVSAAGHGGMSWSAPQTINDRAGGGLNLWPDLAVGPNGDLYAAWLDTPYWFNHQGTIWIDRSTDGGATFGTDVPAVSFWNVPQMLTDTGGQPTYAAIGYPSCEVDPSNASHVCAVYACDPDDGPAVETRLDVGDQPPGASDVALPLPFSGTTAMGCSNGYVYGVWVDHRTSPRGVFFNRSQTGIAQWNGPERMLSTQPTPERLGSNNANLACDGQNVYVVWDECNLCDFIHLIYFNASYDNGVTWLNQAVPIDTQQQIYAATEPAVACSGSHVAVAWLTTQGMGGPTYINLNRSSNGGATWLTGEITLSTGGGAGRPDIAMSGSHVYVTWMEAAGSGSEIMVNVSHDYGATWSGPLRLDSGPAGTISYAPKVVASGTYAYVVWDDKRTNVIENPYLACTHNNGYNWYADRRINLGVPAGTSRDDFPQIACQGANVYAVYSSDRYNLNTARDIYFNASYDGGLTWMTPDVPISHDGVAGTQLGTSFEVHPRVSVFDYGTDQYVYVTWQSDRHASAPMAIWDAYATYANNWGQNWAALDHRIDVGSAPGSSTAELPHIASDYTGPYYQWRDDRNGAGDIYANQYRTGPDEGDIQFIESFDGGQTWSPPLRVNDDNTTNDQTHPWIDIKPNGTIDVVWYDKRNDVNDQIPEVYRAVMLPGAGAFQASQPVSNQPIQIPTGPFGMGDYTWIDVDATDAHVVWTDSRYGPDNLQGDIYYNPFENPEPPQQKACCLSAATCIVTTEGECAAAGGEFLPEFDTCDPNPCPYDEMVVCCQGEQCLLVWSEMECLDLGGVLHPEWFTCDFNPCATRYDYADHDVGNCVLTVTKQGIVGFMDHTQSEGSGFLYPACGDNQLFIGGPWGSQDPTYVANRDYDTDPDREWEVSTEPDGRVWIDTEGFSDQDLHAAFTDAGGATPLGLFIEQSSWAWAAPGVADDFVILEYKISSASGAVIEDFYYGLFLDFDLGAGSGDDEGGCVATDGLVYMHDPEGHYVGVALLPSAGDQPDPPLANLTLVHNPTFVWPNQHVPDADKYAFLCAADSAHVLAESYEANDYSVMASAGPMTVTAQTPQKVTFAIVGGASVEELRQSVTVARMILEGGVAGIGDGTSEGSGGSNASGNGGSSGDGNGGPGQGPGSSGWVTRLLPSYPNPCRGEASLTFELAGEGKVSLRVFDISGRCVRSLADGWHAQGRHPVTWLGHDDDGRPVPRGIYYLRLVTAEGTEAQRLLLLR